MESAVETSFKQLDLLAEQLNASSDDPKSLQKCRKHIYKRFAKELRKKGKQKYKISSNKLKNLIKYFKSGSPRQDRTLERIRGRPVKDKQAEEKLAQWIQCSGRTRFTKKQLQTQYLSYINRKKRPPTMVRLMRILDRCSIQNIQILSKQVGIKNAQEAQESEMIEEKQSPSVGQSEEKKLSPEVQLNPFEVEFLSEDDQFFRYPSNMEERAFDQMFNI